MQQRVLHVIGSLNMGGSQSFVLNVYKKINREFIQFDFVIDRESELALKPIVDELGGKVYVMPKFKGTNLLEVIKAWDHFFTEHPEYKIIHSHVRSYAILYLMIAKKHGLRTIIHSHSTSNGSGMGAVVKEILQFPLRFQCDYFFACSQEAGEWLFGAKVVNGDRFHVIKNGIEASKYVFSEHNRKIARDSLDLKEEDIVYIYVGRFSPVKNHLFLLQAFQKIHVTQSNAVLLLVGEGPEKDSIRSRIAELGLKDSVKMLGNRMDIPILLSASDCFLFPSKWEGLGIVAIEAQAAALPCLCSTEVPSLVEVTEFCRFIPLNDLGAWVDNARSFRPARRDTSRDIIQAGFDVSEVAKWLEDFYTALISE